MRILKFGGSSVGSPERIKQVVKIVKDTFDNHQPLAVVVSAFGGVTDELIKVGQQASHGNMNYFYTLLQIKKRHLEAAETLIPAQNLSIVLDDLQVHFKELNNALHGISLIKELSQRSLDFIMSFGERLSAYIISEALKPVIPSAVFLDARKLIKTDRHFGIAHVKIEQTYSLIQNHFSNHSFMPVITGFIGSTEEHETTTLGRGGSDFTASIFGAALNAQEIEIWTDVNGMMTADPRKVQQAFPIPQMSYKEALEMSHFGAKVLHPPTIAPAFLLNIPIRIKNTFQPHLQGTYISNRPRDHEALICGISSIDDVALLRVEGSGMVGVCGIAMRLFGALAKKKINVILISQGSSEHSICFAIRPFDAPHAKEALEEEFFLEMQAGLVDSIIVEEELSVIAIVGENMRKTPGISGKLFGALGKNGINVTAMVQGSSEYNISVVIQKEDEAKALNIIHEAFFLSLTSTLHVFLIGTGLIGNTLIAQMKKQLPILRKEHALDIRIVGLANSQKMYFDPRGIDVMEVQNLLKDAPDKMDIDAYIKKMKELNLMNSVFVDCTANEDVANAYHSILESSISIVTPNKKANSGSYSRYQSLKELSKRKRIKFFYETNVGAGLPIISTVIDLLRSGDKILKIEAILSGTLSFLFNSFNDERSFSDVLREAQKKGFTEPDPREDLNGKDVMRKLLILVRESGYPLEMSDILIEPLLPADCFLAANVEEFYRKLEDYQVVIEEKRSLALREEKALRYVAAFENGKAAISLQAVDKHHPFYHLSGSDNVLALTTERYHETPLVIKGQGAGAEVTAGEIFADIIRISSY
jgi:bifunctional aspartokinase / homoserine dehydrogenase 1